MYKNYVTKTGELKITNKCMSDLMYAIIICKTRELYTFGVGIYELSREQNKGHKFSFFISIDKSKIELFEQLIGSVLRDPMFVSLN